MSNQHKHAKFIHALADGKKVQYFNKKRNEWVTVKNPSWKDDVEYRIGLNLEPWQQELVDAILKDGKTVEFQLSSSWFDAVLNDRVHDHDSLLSYGWSKHQDRYRIKPEVCCQPHIRLDSITYKGIRVADDGSQEDFVQTQYLNFQCVGGDSVNVTLNITS